MDIQFDGPLTLNATGVMVNGTAQAADNSPPSATVKLKFSDLDQLAEWVERVRAAKPASKPPVQTKAGRSKAAARHDRAGKKPATIQPEADSIESPPRYFVPTASSVRSPATGRV